MNEFSKINLKNFDYDAYWEGRGVEIRKKLFPRENVFFNWIKPQAKVLDLAVGSSYLPQVLRQKKGCKVTVFDINAQVIEKQKARGIEGRVQDITDKNFSLSEDYDYIIASETLEHLPVPENVVMKIKDHAKFMVFSIPNSAFYKFRMQLFFGGRFFTQWAVHPGEHLRYWSHTDFLDWLNALGVRVVIAGASNGLDIGPLKFYKLLPNLFGHQMCYLVERAEL